MDSVQNVCHYFDTMPKKNGELKLYQQRVLDGSKLLAAGKTRAQMAKALGMSRSWAYLTFPVPSNIAAVAERKKRTELSRYFKRLRGQA